MVDINQQFGTRKDQLDRQRKALANGYYTKIRSDGLVIAQPRRRDKIAPLKYFLALVVLFFLFKALVLATAGEGTYQSQLNSLSDGTVVERAGAWFLQVDPVTQALSNKVELVLNDDMARL
ncbi:hypothetical protein SAMN04488040_2652 [Sulfitobacter marinus]|uniref:Uncharacterized protein n=1 Tax=Sulfitobacter marinus TaxID=394264 RepID=A0A1I6UD34_9RHOB|nr:hypothetical protein [Sulfitobacter marinus]SFS99314.1 hypothetical protein SAMN04488040_2652 [Sulfitobacter marinus]